MLHLAHKIKGTPVLARDGEIGTLDDFLFEPSRWAIRYLVVDTGAWLGGRKVLLSPMSVDGPWDKSGIRLLVRKAEVGDSPDLTPSALERPSESALLEYYRHPLYWEGVNIWGMFDTPAALVAARGELLACRDDAAEGGAVTDRLRSTEELKGFHIEASDGEIGHVDDFLIGEESWRIRYLLVDTSNWIGGQSVLVGTDVVEAVDSERGKLRVSDSREDIRRSPSYESIIDTLSPAETGPPFMFV
jgi:uncharacterized protein YrrD